MPGPSFSEDARVLSMPAGLNLRKCVVLIGAIPFALAACASQPAGHEASRPRTARAQSYTMQQCMREWAQLSEAQKNNAAAVMDAPPRSAGALFCRRTLEGLSTGRLSVEDIENNAGNYARLVEVIQGR